MLTRRRFLGYGAAGFLALGGGGCSPHNLERLIDQPDQAAKLNGSLAGKSEHAKLKNRLLGYPINMAYPPEEFFEWRRELNGAGIGQFAYNNVGNPYKASSIPYNTHDFEREIILTYGKLLEFPANKTWGFISNSGTDSNMHGMYMGKILLKGRTGNLPKAYFTKEAHYSIQILRDLLGLETVFVNTLPDGGMDAGDLKLKLAENSDQPALVVATIGTTFKGAIDLVESINEVLKPYPSYLHVDAALFGGYLPFTSHRNEVVYHTPDKPNAARYDSIAVSCHKFFGFPAPAGLFLTTKNRFEEFNAYFSRIHNPEYIHHVPGTITCSRDAVKPAEFYFFTTPSAMAALTGQAKTILDNTAYLLQEMQTSTPQLKATRANVLSNTIYFRKPGEWIVKKYSLATMRLEINQQPQEYAHVVVMPHAESEILNEFLSDLAVDKSTLT
jgi:glutamate/tyrosine decarboxylase-like PLP-dependent enzyme